MSACFYQSEAWHWAKHIADVTDSQNLCFLECVRKQKPSRFFWGPLSCVAKKERPDGRKNVSHANVSRILVSAASYVKAFVSSYNMTRRAKARWRWLRYVMCVVRFIWVGRGSVVGPISSVIKRLSLVVITILSPDTLRYTVAIDNHWNSNNKQW